MTRAAALLAALVLVAGCHAPRVRLVPRDQINVLVVVRTVGQAKLAGALVTLGSTQQRTDAGGALRLRITAGTYPIRVEAPGYVAYRARVTLTTDALIGVPLLEAR